MNSFILNKHYLSKKLDIYTRGLLTDLIVVYRCAKIYRDIFLKITVITAKKGL